MLILKEYKKMPTVSLILEFCIHRTSSLCKDIEAAQFAQLYLKTLMPDQKA